MKKAKKQQQQLRSAQQLTTVDKVADKLTVDSGRDQPRLLAGQRQRKRQ